MIRVEMIVGLAAALLFGLGGAGSLSAQDKGKPGKLESKSEKEAGVPDFTKGLGAPFDSVQSLSLRLLDARRKGDPIALALIATELDLAEKVANKKAEVTAADIRKEAIDLVKLRSVDTELKAMSLLVKDQELAGLAKEAQERETKRIEDAKKVKGVTPRGVHVLEVTNHTNRWAHIRVNGHQVGSVPPHSNNTFQLHQMHHNVHEINLAAYDHQGDHWRGHYLTGQHHHFHWILNP